MLEQCSTAYRWDRSAVKAMSCRLRLDARAVILGTNQTVRRTGFRHDGVIARLSVISVLRLRSAISDELAPSSSSRWLIVAEQEKCGPTTSGGGTRHRNTLATRSSIAKRDDVRRIRLNVHASSDNDGRHDQVGNADMVANTQGEMARRSPP